MSLSLGFSPPPLTPPSPSCQLGRGTQLANFGLVQGGFYLPSLQEQLYDFQKKGLEIWGTKGLLCVRAHE